MAGESFYDILNIRKDATPDEIKKAYRDLAKQYHPDKNKAPEAAERIKSINRAHEVLSNPIERAKYDKARRNGYEYDNNDNNSSWSMPDMGGHDPKEWFNKVFSEEFDTDDPFTEHQETFRTNMRSSESENFRARERSKQQNTTRNSEFGTSHTFGGRKRKPDFGEWSSSRFGGSFDREPTSWSSAKKPRQEHSSTGRSGCSANLPKDAVIERPLEVSLEEIATGCVKKLKIKRTIYDERGYSSQEEHVIEIPIKPGWKAGTKLTYPNLGDKHPGRDPADITFILRDKPHALFSRDSDNNLLHTANVSLKKALLGVSYCIQGLNGRRHDVNVKDIVHPGYTKRYAGEGLPLPKTPSKRGDLVVTFNIEFPTFLSWDQRRVLTDCLPN